MMKDETELLKPVMDDESFRRGMTDTVSIYVQSRRLTISGPILRLDGSCRADFRVKLARCSTAFRAASPRRRAA